MPSLNTISYPSGGGSGNTSDSRRSIRSRLLACSDRVYNAIENWRRFPGGRERNLFAAFFTLLALTVLSASLADEEWIYVEGGKCGLKHIGVSLFYGWGYFQHRQTMESIIGDNGLASPARARIHVVYTVAGRSYYDCINPTIADVFHGLMGVLFVAVATTSAAFVLDTFGAKQGFLAWLRRNSVFNIFAVIFCVIVIGLTYWVSLEVEQQQRDSVSNPETVRVSFEDGFFLVIAGGTFSICALVANLIKSSVQIKRRCQDRLALLDHIEHNEGEYVPSGGSSRQNLLLHHHHRRLLSMAVAASNPRLGAELPFTAVPPSSSSSPMTMMMPQPAGMMVTTATERPIGSMGPPPPLQMILNIPPPPPYSP